MASTRKNLFARLTSLYRSGPIVKRKVKGIDSTSLSTKSSAVDVLRKSSNSIYTNTANAYGSFDRLARLSDYAEMEQMAEVAAGLDIYADESFSPDEKGYSLHIYSENKKIQKILEELFYDTLDIEFFGRAWIRNLCKYGDFFLLNDVSPEFGVVNVYPIPVNEIEREQGYDSDNPSAVRFRWVTQNKELKEWEITHFRLLGRDEFLPYGASVLEPARRAWRQVIMAEDAMLVYRIIRSPERRVFYIDVGNTAADDVPNVIEAARAQLKTQYVVDKASGRVDMRYNPFSVDIDYFIATRGAESTTRVDTLPGGVNTTAIDDVQYLQSKLFAGLKIPKPYLTFDENLGSKASLAQLDIRFSRTISQIQKMIIAELNKIAVIHLTAHGYEGDNLVNFHLQLSNPSTIAQQQKLELLRTKLEIMAAKPEGMLSNRFMYKEAMELTDDQIDKIEQEQTVEAKRAASLEDTSDTGTASNLGGGGGGFSTGGGGLDLADFSAGEELGPEGGEIGTGEPGLGGDTEEPAGEGDEELGDEEDIFASDEEDDHKPLLTDDEDETINFSLDEDEQHPVKKRSVISTIRHNRQRRRHMKGASQNMMPKLADMVSGNNKDFSDPNDKRHFNSLADPFNENVFEKKLEKMENSRVRLTREIQKTLVSLKQDISINKNKLISEDVENEDEE